MRILILLASSLAWAQEFDVASIKASEPFATNGPIAIRIGPPTGGPGTSDPTHYTWPSATLRSILMRAYDVKTFQISGPDWLGSERFDIAVVIPEGATKEQLAVMWRNLLASRFGVKLRVEKKEFAVDELVIGPKGHKLKETADPNVAAFNIQAGSSPLKDGKLNGAGLITMMRTSPAGVTAQVMGVAQALGPLADMLSNQLGHPVVDKTGLTGKYDFTVDFSPGERFSQLAPPPPPGAGAPSPGPALPSAAEVGVDLATAIQQQLGLRIEKGKGMLDYIVVEKAERVPTEN